MVHLQVLGEVEKQYKKRMGQKMGKMSDSLPSVRPFFPLFHLKQLLVYTDIKLSMTTMTSSLHLQVIIDEPAKPSAPRHGSDSSGFGSGKGEPTKVLV